MGSISRQLGNTDVSKDVYQTLSPRRLLFIQCCSAIVKLEADTSPELASARVCTCVLLISQLCLCFKACYWIKIMNSDNNTTVSDGAPPPDQYADGVAAALPDFYCRMPAYKQWLSSVIGGRGYKTVLDAAFGNGYVVAPTKSTKPRQFASPYEKLYTKLTFAISLEVSRSR